VCVTGVVVAQPPRLTTQITLNSFAILTPITFDVLSPLLLPTWNDAEHGCDDLKDCTQHKRLFNIQSDCLEEVYDLFQERIVRWGRCEFDNDASSKNDATNSGYDLLPI
jgi:hypothetical protein